MRAGSLFSGVGGLDLGLHRAGFEHVFFAESDEWRRTVLAQHWPGVPIYEDVREVDAASWAARVGAGRREVGGGDGEPSGNPSLVNGEGARGDVADVGLPDIHLGRGRGGADAQPAGRPHLAVDLLCGGFPCQDVSVAGRRAGLAGARSGLFHEFARIADALRPRWLLVENVPGLLSSNGGRDFGVVVGTLADLGYGVAWRVLDSRFFGVPQRRRRVFIVGAVAGSDPRAASVRAGQVLAVGSRCAGHPATRAEAGQDVARPLGSGTRAGRSGGGQRYDLDNDTYIASAVTAKWAKGNGGPAGDEAQNLTTATSGVRRLTPTECERLQAWPDGWTSPDGKAPDSRRYAACGDGVTSTVAEWIGRRILAAQQLSLLTGEAHPSQ